MFVGVDKYAKLGSRCLVDADEMKKEVDADGVKKERKRLSGGEECLYIIDGQFLNLQTCMYMEPRTFPEELGLYLKV